MPTTLPRAAREPRAAIESEFAIDGQHVRVFATHFGLSAKERRLQFETLRMRILQSDPGLCVVCADFNEWLPYSAVRRGLGRLLGRTPAPRSFPAGFPILSIDRIYAKPAAALLSVQAISNRLTRSASDHLPLVAEVRLEHAKNPEARHAGDRSRPAPGRR